MKTTIALIIKFIATFAAAWISFMLFDNLSLSIVFIIAIAGTILNYVIGDLFVLPNFGNATASIVDGILSAITAYLILIFTPAVLVDYTSIFLFAIITAACEIFFHMYLFRAHIVEHKSSDSNKFNRKKLNYNTETADELNPLNNTWRDDNVRGRSGDKGSRDGSDNNSSRFNNNEDDSL